MSFLAPTTALLAAGVVLPLLVAMYLLKLRRRPMRVSSTLLWEKFGSDVQVNVPLARPRVSWLMLLHLLIVAALLAAVGRPVLPSVAGSAGRLIVVLDHSASMNARDGVRGQERVTRLEEAKDRALRAVTGAGRASASIAVVSLSASARVVREFSPDATLAALAIGDVRPTDQPGNLAAAAEVVRALLFSLPDAESGTGVDVLLFSDGVFEAGGVDAPSVPMRLVRVGEPGAGVGAGENLGIVALAARRIESDLEAVEIFARVQSTALEPRVVPVSLALSGRVVETRSVIVPAAAQEAAGEVSVTFACRPGGRELATLSLGVDEARDLLAADNAASLMLRGFRPPRVILVTKGAVASVTEEEVTPLSAGFLLRDVLEELGLGELKRVSLGEYEELVSTNQLRFFDAVIFDGVAPAGTPTLASLSINAGVPECPLLAPTADGPARPVLSWTRSHPLLQFITLDGVVVARARPMRDEKTTFATIARGAWGPLLLVRDSVDEPRRIIVTFDLTDSNWPLEPSFAIFMNAAVAWLTNTGASDAARQFTTLDSVTVDAPEGDVLQYERVGRDSGEGVVRAPVMNSRANLGILERAGVYVPITSGEVRADPTRQRSDPVAVNLLNPVESSVATSDTLLVGRRAVLGAAAGPAALEIWWWFLLAALGLLVIEWVVFTRSAHT